MTVVVVLAEVFGVRPCCSASSMCVSDLLITVISLIGRQQCRRPLGSMLTLSPSQARVSSAREQGRTWLADFFDYLHEEHLLSCSIISFSPLFVSKLTNPS